VSNGSGTIFIVDDDDSLRASLERRLRAEGWNVESFANALEFLRRPTYNGVGCVLLDVCLPQVTGPDLQIAMMARGDTLPVVFLTGRADVATGVSAMKRGAVDFLVKPIDEETLLRAIAQAIERHGAEQRARLQRQVADARLARLSPREREVLNFVISGRLNKQIAQSMGITLKTVKVHRAHVMQKMGVSSVAALVHLCDGARPAAAKPPAESGSGRDQPRVQWRHQADGVYPREWG
jgi:FixJ family two-component response regulator